MVDRLCRWSFCAFVAAIPAGGILWILSVPDYFQLGLVSEQAALTVLGLGLGAAFLKHPYGEKPGLLELGLALAGSGVWFWAAYNLQDWYFLAADRPPEMWVPAIFAILVMMEGVRKAAGLVIAGIVWTLLIYGFLGDHLPGVIQAEVFPPTKTLVYLYTDVNGIPGIVLRIVVELVLAFVIFGKMMDVSGAMGFMNDMALSLMGHRRGGPAKVSVAASAAFGSISGSTVANIMSTGVITIPMMQRAGFKPKFAAAIEAVASNGGQIAPPVMGATAFIIAEFLEVPYGEVALAALLPAVLYFFVIFLQVDGVAVRYGIEGTPRAELPKALDVLKSGWIYLAPLVVLVYFLLGLGYRAGLSGLYACGVLFALMILKNRRLPTRMELHGFFVGGGENLLPLIMIGAGAGVIIGLMNSTGLGFQLSLALTEVGQSYGVFVMLLLTAFICVLLGMGMPTAAVYVVLVSIIAPSLVEMEVPGIAAHMFIFYFGLLSMLTPPVAIASMVAAQMAGSNMWATALIGLQLALAAFLLPFLWVFNPAVLGEGSWIEIGLVVATCGVAGLLMGKMAMVIGADVGGTGIGLLLLATAIVVGSATVWIGPADPMTLAPAALGLAVAYFYKPRKERRV